MNTYLVSKIDNNNDAQKYAQKLINLSDKLMSDSDKTFLYVLMVSFIDILNDVYLDFVIEKNMRLILMKS